MTVLSDLLPNARDRIAAMRKPLPGDDRLHAPNREQTDARVIHAQPEQIWPWLVQMGCRRGGFYAIDSLDNGGQRSAREIHPELQDLRLGDVLPATPGGQDGFEVLTLEPNHALVLGSLYDITAKRQLRFDAPLPPEYWKVTWAFVLEKVNGDTRVYARSRARFPPEGRAAALWIADLHQSMQRSALKHLAARVEHRLPRDDWRDVVDGVAGLAVMASAFATPFRRAARCRWGLDETEAHRPLPGDELIPLPTWGWTHGTEIDVPPAKVWPWVRQLGADRGGFYSYQWLENLAGSNVHNAETVHPEWEPVHSGTLLLHPKMPAMRVQALAPGHYLVAHGTSSSQARTIGKGWVEVSWLFMVEPLPDQRSRLISRFRCVCGDDWATRLQFGPGLLEPISFAMDRRLLLGIKERAETVAAHARRAMRRILPVAASDGSEP